jgi:ParB family chromosome partitioning protein
LENLIAAEKKPVNKESSKETKIPEEYIGVQNRFREYFGVGKVQLKVNAEGKGQIVIPFANTKDLNDLLDRLEENN